MWKFDIFFRPDYYAQELLATISNLLNSCTQPNDQGVCAILIDSLAFLCESEVVDMISTWNALEPQFKNEKGIFLVKEFILNYFKFFLKIKIISDKLVWSFYVCCIKTRTFK